MNQEKKASLIKWGWGVSIALMSLAMAFAASDRTHSYTSWVVTCGYIGAAVWISAAFTTLRMAKQFVWMTILTGAAVTMEVGFTFLFFDSSGLTTLLLFLFAGVYGYVDFQLLKKNPQIWEQARELFDEARRGRIR